MIDYNKQSLCFTFIDTDYSVNAPFDVSIRVKTVLFICVMKYKSTKG